MQNFKFGRTLWLYPKSILCQTKDFLAPFLFPPLLAFSQEGWKESKYTPKFCYTIVCLHLGHKSIADLFPPFLLVSIVFFFDLIEESELSVWGMLLVHRGPFMIFVIIFFFWLHLFLLVSFSPFIFVCILFLHVVVTCDLALHFKGASYGFSFLFFFACPYFNARFSTSCIYIVGCSFNTSQSFQFIFFINNGELSFSSMVSA